MISQNWLAAVGLTLVTAPWVLLALDKHKVLYRKIIFWVSAICAGFNIAFCIIAVIVVAVEPEQMSVELENQCLINPDLQRYYGYEECADKLYTWILYAVVISACIGIPIRLLIVRVLYYGQKEQEEHQRQQAVYQGQQAVFRAHMVEPATTGAPADPEARFYQPVNQMA